MHVYISTACQHERHGRCRRVCKFCRTDCLCLCHHRPKGTAMSNNPENVDNPAVPDVDVDPPVEVTPEQGEPVTEPLSDATAELGQNAGSVTYQEDVDEDGQVVKSATAMVEDDDQDLVEEIGADDDGEIGNLDDLPAAADEDLDPDADADTGADDADPGVATDDDPLGAGKDA